MTVILALAAALVYGGGVSLQQRAAQEVPADLAGRPSLLLRLARRPLWLIGLVADIGGFALQAAALSQGSLVVVQPLITTSLLVTLVVIAAGSGIAITFREWAAIALVLGGLVVLLTVGSPHGGASVAVGTLRWVICSTSLAAIGLVCLLTGLRCAGAARAAWIAVAAGVGDAFMAVLTKAFTGEIGHGVAHLVVSWTPYGLAAAGVAAMLLTQSAYQAGWPTVTLPIITVTEPLLSSVVGVTVFGEKVQLGMLHTPAIVIAAAGMAYGLVTLGRTSRLANAQVADMDLGTLPRLDVDVDIDLDADRRGVGERGWENPVPVTAAAPGCSPDDAGPAPRADRVGTIGWATGQRPFGSDHSSGSVAPGREICR